MDQFSLTIYHRAMSIRLSFAIITALAISLPVYAHNAAYSVFDFEQTERGTVLVVGIQPELAMTVIGKSHDDELALDYFRDKLPLIVAYVEESVELTQGDASCTWNAEPDPLPDTVLGMQADGITIRGLVECLEPGKPFTLTTDLFVDAHPFQENWIRYRDGERYITFAELNGETRSANVDLREVFQQTIGQTEDAVRDAKRANTAIGVIIIVGAIGIAFWVRRKASTG